LRATVSSMRLQRKNSVVLSSSSSSVLSTLSSHEYVSSHKSVKSSWSCHSVLFDGFGPEQASFPHFTIRFFQAVYGQKSSADIMCAPSSHSLSLSCRQYFLRCRDFFLTALALALNGKHTHVNTSTLILTT
jgi:hypothetical protein